MMSAGFFTKLKVGITSIVALVVLFCGVLWVKQYNPTKKRNDIVVVFEDAKGITAGDPVLVSGIRVGEVTSVSLREGNKAEVRCYVLGNIRLYSDCGFYIKDVGLMGDKALVVEPGSREPEIEVGGPHIGTDSTDLSDLITGGKNIIRRLENVTARLDEDLDVVRLSLLLESTLEKIQEVVNVYEEVARENREPLRKSISAVEASAAELNRLVSENGKNFEETLASFRRTSEKISAALDDIERIGSIADTLAVYMESGEGTLAKLVKSDELYEELRRTNASIDSFITDFRKDPGKYTKDMKFKIRLF